MLNTGATVIVSATHAGERNAMAAAWNMALDFAPDASKCAVVIDKSAYTRGLIERSNRFALGICAKLGAADCMALGSHSAYTAPEHNKLHALGIDHFDGNPHPDGALPLTLGCIGWLECERYPEPHAEGTYDLFVGRITQAWANTRCFANGKYLPVDEIPPELRTIHHLGAGNFVLPGEQIRAK